MDYCIVEVNGTHIRIEGGSRASARRRAIEDFGRNNVTSVTTRAVTEEEVRHILNMGGHVPLSLRQRFGIVED